MCRIPAYAQGVHDFFGHDASAGVLGIERVEPCVVFAEGADGGEHGGDELAGVDVALDFENPADELRVGGEHAHAPSGHGVALGEGIHLDGDVGGAGCLEDAAGSVVEDEGVGVVVDNDDVMASGKVDGALEDVVGGLGACGHVGVVEPHEPDAVEGEALHGVEVGEPSAVLGEGIFDDASADEA